MRFKTPGFVLLLVLLVGCGGESSAPPNDPPTGEAGTLAAREYTRMFYAGELDALFEKFSPELRGSFPRDQLRALHDRVANEYGREIERIGEDWKADGEYRGFVRWARFDAHDGLIEVLWILRDDDTIAGVFVRPKDKPES